MAVFESIYNLMTAQQCVEFAQISPRLYCRTSISD